jgi:hypothetical protein
MDMLSMALGVPSTAALTNRVVSGPATQMNDLAEKMLKTGLELKVKGKEMGKGQFLDVAG